MRILNVKEEVSSNVGRNFSLASFVRSLFLGDIKLNVEFEGYERITDSTDFAFFPDI